MSRKRRTDLENRIRWYFENCDVTMDLEVLELLKAAEWNEEHTKLIVDPRQISKKYLDLYELAMKIGEKDSTDQNPTE